MIIPFDKLKNYDFSLSNINVICQKPFYKVLKVEKRGMNGFLYIKYGECRYLFNEHEITLSPGALIYLPLSSKHTLIVTSEEIEFYRVNFTLHINNEVALFSNEPMKITDYTPAECVEAIRSLEEDYRFENDTVVKTEKLCHIISTLQKSQLNPRAKKLAPALTFLNNHLTERFNCKKLASLCYLSTAQFYNLFDAEFSLTPLEYRDKLLIQRAAVLLKSDGITVGEVATMLGFEDSAYFSRFFKKHKGVSPSEYIKRNGSKITAQKR